MIRSITVKPSEKHVLSWTKDCPWIQNLGTLQFTAGLNILVGPNGSGKSTLLTTMAKILHCYDAGHQHLTTDSIDQVVPFQLDPEKRKSRGGIQVDWDGSPVMYTSAAFKTASTLQDDFFEQQFFEHFKDHTSEGLRTLRRLGDTLEILAKVPDFTEERVSNSAKHWNDLWSTRAKEAWSFIAPTGEKGPATLLLDEPERSVSPVLFYKVLRFLSRLPACGVQVILVTHSPQVAQLQGPVNFIETAPGYLEELRAILPPLTVVDTVAVADYRVSLGELLQSSFKKK